jgi:hypothetical protein
MAKASNNEFPSVLFGEQGSAPATPSASTVRLFFDTTARPLLKSIDSSSDVETYATTGDLDAYVAESLVDAKGDLLVGTADDTVGRLAVGTDGHVLTADSGEASGVKWAAAAGGSSGLGAVTLNAQTGTTYTLVLGDASKMVTLDNAAAITLTVPPNSSVAFPTGSRIALLQKGAGQVTVAQGSGVTVNTSETLKLQDQWAAAELIKLDTDSWVLVGRLEAA